MTFSQWSNTRNSFNQVESPLAEQLTQAANARRYVCMGFVALITALVLCATSQDALLSVSVRRVHVVFPTAEFKGGGKPCPTTRETAALRRGIKLAPSA